MGSINTYTDTWINISTRKEFPVLKRSPEEDEVRVAFLKAKEGEELTVENSLFIKDDSLTSPNNQNIQEKSPVIFDYNPNNWADSMKTLVSTFNLEATDIFRTQDGIVTPLFYKHVWDARVSGEISSLEFLDRNFNPIPSNNVYFNENDSIFYNSIPTVDKMTGDFNINYLRYTLRLNNNEAITQLKLLNNEVVCSGVYAGPWESIVPTSGQFLLYVPAESNQAVLQMPSSGLAAYQLDINTKIEILPPKEDSIEKPWNISISNGLFVENDLVIWKLTNFYNPEDTIAMSYPRNLYGTDFRRQVWSLEKGYPYKNIVNGTGTVLSNRLIKLNRKNLFINPLDSSDNPIDIAIFDKEGSPVFAFTTDTSKYGTLDTNQLVWQEIGSINQKVGIIDIPGNLLDLTYTISATFLFKETEVEITEIDFNPINNPMVQNNKVVFFLFQHYVFYNPITDMTGRVIRYLVVNPTGKVIYSNWEYFDNSTMTVSPYSNSLYYGTVPDWDLDNGIDFKTELTLETDDYVYPLGEVAIAPNVSIRDIDYLDIRQRGGGLDANKISTLKETNPEIQWFWDLGHWDGTPYPGNASIYIEVPSRLLNGAGGSLYTNEIKEVIERHLAAGVYPVAKTYGVDPRVFLDSLTTTTVTISWDSQIDKFYNVYYSKNTDGPWTLANNSSLSDNLSGNTYTVTGLLANNNYSILVIGGTLDEQGNLLPLTSQPLSDLMESVMLTSPYILIVKTLGV